MEEERIKLEDLKKLNFSTTEFVVDCLQVAYDIVMSSGDVLKKEFITCSVSKPSPYDFYFQEINPHITSGTPLPKTFYGRSYKIKSIPKILNTILVIENLTGYLNLKGQICHYGENGEKDFITVTIDLLNHNIKLKPDNKASYGSVWKTFNSSLRCEEIKNMLGFKSNYNKYTDENSSEKLIFKMEIEE